MTSVSRVPVRHSDSIGAATEVLAVEPIDGDCAIVTYRHVVSISSAMSCEATSKVQLRSRAAPYSATVGIGDNTSSSNISH